MTHPTVLRTPSRADSSWCIKVDPCSSAHVGAFRGPLGKLGVMGRVWGSFSACFLRETLKRDKPRILLGTLLAFFRFVLA